MTPGTGRSRETQNQEAQAEEKITIIITSSSTGLNGSRREPEPGLDKQSNEAKQRRLQDEPSGPPRPNREVLKLKTQLRN